MFCYDLLPSNKNNPEMNREEIQRSRILSNVMVDKDVYYLFSSFNIIARIIYKPVHLKLLPVMGKIPKNRNLILKKKKILITSPRVKFLKLQKGFFT